uniref:RING-type domain-containing protein n=1 Tax=Caenorhabditis tropicalis TaxID=1561998 RepID=A0A1I7UHL1_9PELO
MHDEDFCCAVCLDFFIEPCIIKCGHSFCHLCIESQLNINEKCPLCRAHTGNPIRNRQLESLTMSYVSSRNLSGAYYERMKLNQKKLIHQKKALLIIWTELSDKPGHSTELSNLNIQDEELKSEIRWQVRQQVGVGLEHIGDLETETVTIRLKTSRQ